MKDRAKTGEDEGGCGDKHLGFSITMIMIWSPAWDLHKRCGEDQDERQGADWGRLGRFRGQAFGTFEY